MRELIEQIEQLSGVIRSADAGDLTGLADAHSRLEQVSRTISELPGEKASALGRAAALSASTRTRLENLILNEVSDADGELGEISKSIGELQKSVSAALSASPPIRLNPEDIPLIGEFVSEAAGHLEQADRDLQKLAEEPGDLETIGSLFRSLHTIKAVAGFLNLEVIQSLSHAAEGLLDRARVGSIHVTGRASELLIEAVDQLNILVVGLDSAAKSGKALEPVQGAADLVERLNAFVVALENDPDASTRNPAMASESAPACGLAGQCAARRDENTVKVAADRLNSLVNRVRELVITQSQVEQAAAPFVTLNQQLGDNLAQLRTIACELHALSASLRSTQIHQVFQKMNRLVRDLARRLGKDVELTLSGGDTELDRAVVEALNDPLMHMMRNCIDHGIETPEERQREGKPRQGRIELIAFRGDGSVTIEIRDDGRGLRKERILQKAIENGLVAPDARMTDRQIHQLIFAAGLSTADRVSDISGRGVGMDVVRENIARLGGQIDISTTEGSGTTFTILLPDHENSMPRQGGE